jgi:hypothetical protein
MYMEIGDGWLFIVLDKGIAMKKNMIRDKNFDFAIRMIGVCTGIQSERKEYVLSKQLLGAAPLSVPCLGKRSRLRAGGILFINAILRSNKHRRVNAGCSC